MVLSNHLILCPPPPLDFSLSQHRDLFQWVSCSHQVARILELQLQHQSFQWIFRVDFLSDWLVWSPWCPRDSQESSAAPQFEGINSSALSLLYSSTLTSVHDHWKHHRFDYMDLCQQSDVSVNTLSRLPRSKYLLISWLQSPSAVILEPKKIKSVTDSTFSNSICHKMMGPDALILFFKCWFLSQLSHSPLSPSSRGSLVLFQFLPLEWCHLHISGCWYFSRQSWFWLVLHLVPPFLWCTRYIS